MLDQVMGQLFARILPILVLAGLVSVIIAILRASILPGVKGRMGESTVNARTRAEGCP